MVKKSKFKQDFSYAVPGHTPYHVSKKAIMQGPHSGSESQKNAPFLVPAPPSRISEHDLVRLHALFEQAPGFVALVEGPDQVFRLVNRAFCELVGQQALLGRPAREVLPELDAQGYFALADRVLKTGQPFVGRQMRVEWRSAQDNQSPVRYIDFVLQPLSSTDGQPLGVFIQGHDVTEQKLAQDALNESAAHWRFAIEGAQDGVWDWDVTTNKVFVSGRYLEILGSEGEAGLEDFNHLVEDIHPEDYSLVMKELHAAAAGGPAYRCEFRLRCKRGNYIWVAARGRAVAHEASGRVLRVAGTLTDISAQKQAEDELWRAASYDSLTGLPNRKLLRERLANAIERAQSGGNELAVMIIDLDRFREVNDLHGHGAGDELLNQAAERLKNCVRLSGTVARAGGDEFVVVLTHTHGRQQVADVAQNIIAQLAMPFRAGASRMHLSASIGISLYPQDACDPEELIRNADQAMNAAKKAGRNQFRFFAKAMQDDTRRRIQLAQDLRQAVAVQQLEIYYQPVIEMQSRRIAKAEALLRWPHPELGFVSPDQFIPLAEESGLIHELGNWVFTETAAWSHRWNQTLNQPLQLSVNCSPVQVSTQTALNWLHILEAKGVPPRNIAVEITEGVLLSASPHVAELLRRYRAAGMQIALDDFGTGYSSLKYLMQFDLDFLKIDQSFVREIDTNEGSRAIVESLIAMAHRLGIKVIAEGIEKPEQEQILRAAGCEYGQGFLFSKAVPPLELEEMLKQQ